MEIMLKQVRAEVMVETGNEQVPWTSSSLAESFYFVPPPTIQPTIKHTLSIAGILSGSTLKINGNSVSYTNNSFNAKYPPGTYAITVAKSGYYDYVRSVELTDNATVTVSQKSIPSPTDKDRTLFYTLLIGSGLSAGTSLVSFLASQDAYSTHKREQNFDDIKAAYDQSNAIVTGSVVSLLLTVVGLIGSYMTFK